MFGKEKPTVAEDLLRRAYKDKGRLWISGDDLTREQMAGDDPDGLARRLRAATQLPGFTLEEIQEDEPVEDN